MRSAQTLLLAGVIGLAVFLVYANALRVPFLFDDQPSIVENPTIRHLSATAFSPPAGLGVTVEGRPLVNVSLALNYALSGTNVGSYHVTNIAIHFLAALTLFGLVRRTLRRLGSEISSRATEIALAASLLWALHPLQTESVTYIVQRTESLMGLLYLLTLYGFVRGCEAGNSRGWFALSIGACALGMATKEVMVSAPLMVWLYDRTFVAGSFRAAWRQRRNLYLGLAATWLVLAYLVLATGSRGGTIGATAGVTWWEYAFCQARAVVHYLWLAGWPSPLIFDYGSDFVTFGEIFPYAILDLVLLGLTVAELRRRPALGFLGAWFFVILAPTSSVVGGTRQMLAEHRTYLSLATVAVLVAVGICRWLPRRGWIVWSALAISLGLLTVRRNEDYRTALSLYRDTVAKRPENPHAHNNLGQALSLDGHFPEAVEEFRAALRLSPPRSLAMAHSHLAAALYQAGRVDEAVAEANAALKVNPKYPEAHYNLATALLRSGQRDTAIAEFETALRLQPNYPEAYENLAAALMQTGRSAEALQHYEEAVRLNPDRSEAHFNLAVAQQQVGDFPAALGHYETALRLRPDYAEAHNNLGVVLMRLNRMPEAIEHYQAALRSRPDYAEAHSNLGSALAEKSQWPEAITHFEAALRSDPNNTQAHFDLGNVFCATGRVADAIPHFEAAVRAAPDNPEYRNNLGSALLEGSNRIDDAIAQFNAALKLRPDSAETHFNLGVALADRDSRADAIRHLEEAIRLRPDYAQARDMLAKVRAAKQ